MDERHLWDFHKSANVTPFASLLLKFECLYNDSISPWTNFLQMSFPPSINRTHPWLTFEQSHFTFQSFFPLLSALWQFHRFRAKFQLTVEDVWILQAKKIAGEQLRGSPSTALSNYFPAGHGLRQKWNIWTWARAYVRHAGAHVPIN